MMFERFVSQYVLRRNGLIGAAFLRVILSTIAAINDAWHIGTRQALWGPNGQIDFATYAHSSVGNVFALYRYNSSQGFDDILLFGSLAIAVLYGIGFLPRVTCWFFAITAYAALQRNFQATDAGQTLLVLTAFLLCFMDTSRYFSLFRTRRLHSPDALATLIGNLLHNAGRFLIAWQVCMIYYWASFYKLGGSDWRTGSAMYYVLHLERFAWFPGLSNLLSENGVLIALVTYATLAFQGGFPFLMWNQRVKPYLVAGAFMLHTGIAVLMGLMSFSATMIAVDSSILSDEQMLALWHRVRPASLVKSCAEGAPSDLHLHEQPGAA